MGIPINRLKLSENKFVKFNAKSITETHFSV